MTELNPRPNLALNPSQEKLALTLSESIHDEFEIPDQNSIKGGSAVGWHSSLRNGFRNGFEDGFELSETADDAGYVLELEMTELEYVPAAVRADGYVVGANAQLRFKANLTTPSGEVRRVAGTAVSKKSVTNRADAGNVAASAIETMYETLAQKLFESDSSVD